MPPIPLTCRTLGSALAFTAAWLLLLAPAGFAAEPKAPPGNSGVQEYVESVPDGSGGKVANKLYHGRNAALRDPGATRGLAGKDGARAAALAKAGAPRTKKGAGSGESGSSAFVAVFNRLPIGGIGFVPLVLLVLLLGYEVIRRRVAS
jgi:hypothetical protein